MGSIHTYIGRERKNRNGNGKIKTGERGVHNCVNESDK